MAKSIDNPLTADKTTPLRVLYATMRFPVRSETFAAVEVRGLRAAGVDISIACLRARGADCARLFDEYRLNEVPLTHSGFRSNIRGFWYGLSRPRILLDLLIHVVVHNIHRPIDVLRGLLLSPRILDVFSAVRRDPPDVLHLFWGHYPSLLGLLVHRHVPSTLVSMFLGNYDLARNYVCSAELARQLPTVWTLTEANRPALAQIGITSSRIEVAYHGIEPQPSPGKPTQKIPGRILVIERLIPSKHTVDALRAFALVRKRVPESHLLVLGDGPQLANLQQTAQQLDLNGAITFLGFVPHDDVYAQLTRAEALVSMSRHPSERLPNVVKEAMSQGCVPIVTWSPGIEELIEHERDGIIIAQGDVATAAKMTVQLLTSSVMRKRMAHAARAKVETKFDIAGITERRLDIWNSLLQSRKNRFKPNIENQ